MITRWVGLFVMLGGLAGGALVADDRVRPEGAVSSVAGRPGAKADRPPRKVVIGTAIFSPQGKYPGLSERLMALGDLVERMARLAGEQAPGRKLDLVILPETVVTAAGPRAVDRATPLVGPIQDAFAALARKHHAYILAPMDLAESGPSGPICSNAAVLFDRRGEVVGIARKCHPVALVGSDDLEGGITPGRVNPVFDCDFGRLGVQICFDIQFADAWAELAQGGAEIVAWPTASPATVLPASYAARHRYYVVSSTWRDNATVYEPTGMVAARIESPDRILVHEADLNHAILGWSSSLRNGEALRARFGDRVGFHYSTREDMGLFWSNDPALSIGAMVRSIGGEELDPQVDRNRRLYETAGASGR